MTNIFEDITSFLLKFSGNHLKKKLREVFYGEIVSERIVEYALVDS